jgi:cell division protein FtsB
MIDFKAAQVRRHRQNIERYCRLLATELTGLERQYLHKRIAEEHAQLEHLKKSEEEQHAEVRPLSTGEHCDLIGAGE